MGVVSTSIMPVFDGEDGGFKMMVRMRVYDDGEDDGFKMLVGMMVLG